MPVGDLPLNGPNDSDLHAAFNDLTDLRAALNDAARETIGRAWRHFLEQGSWPAFAAIEKGVLRALPPGTEISRSLRQTPRWVGWLGDPGHASTMTVKLLALATCIGMDAAPVLQNFWRAFSLARSIFLATADDEKAQLDSGRLGASQSRGELGMTKLEIRQVFALLQSEALLADGRTTDNEEKYEWVFQIANRIHDFRDVSTLADYIRLRKEQEVPLTAVPQNPHATPPPAAPQRPAVRKMTKGPIPKRSRKVRIKIPDEVADEVMFQSDRTCCVCRKPDKSVQIHHLNGDAANNDIDNLAALCFDCHERTQLKGGFGRKLTAGQIRLYRKTWYQMVKNQPDARLRKTSHSKESSVSRGHVALLGEVYNNPHLADLPPTTIRRVGVTPQLDSNQEQILKKLVTAHRAVTKDKRQSFSVSPTFSAIGPVFGPPRSYVLDHPGLKKSLSAYREDLQALAHRGLIELHETNLLSGSPALVACDVTQNGLDFHPQQPGPDRPLPIVPARLVKTELQSTLARLHRLMTQDPALTEDYLLPTGQWAAYRERLAELDSYDRIVKAYHEIARVNDQWRWRREGAGTKRIAVNREKDGLEVLEAAAKDAIAVLDEVIEGC